MDFIGFAALGGLERITIVAGAIFIGYWGYRLYTGEKKAGLVFMGLAVLVLVGALATGNSHLRNVGEGLQLASVPATTAAPEAAPAPSEDAAVAPFAPPEPAVPEAAAMPEPAGAAPAAPEAAETTETADADAEPDVATLEAAPPSPVRLATGQELGGRILSVKSENVSLEWSPDSE